MSPVKLQVWLKQCQTPVQVEKLLDILNPYTKQVLKKMFFRRLVQLPVAQSKIIQSILILDLLIIGLDNKKAM